MDFQAAAPAADKGYIIRQHQQTQGKHPKAQDGKETKHAAQNQQDPNGQPDGGRITTHRMLYSPEIILRHGPAYHELSQTGQEAQGTQGILPDILP